MTNHIEHVQKEITQFIKNHEDYPTMDQLLHWFKGIGTYDFVFALVLCMNDGEIFFDDKHNCWMVPTPFNKDKYIRV